MVFFSGGTVPRLKYKQVLLYFFGSQPALSGRVITPKADELGVNA